MSIYDESTIPTNADVIYGGKRRRRDEIDTIMRLTIHVCEQSCEWERKDGSNDRGE